MHNAEWITPSPIMMHLSWGSCATIFYRRQTMEVQVNTSVKHEWFKVAEPEFLSETVVLKPGGTSGLDGRFCEEEDDFPDSLFAKGWLVVISTSAFLSRSLLSFLLSSSSTEMSESYSAVCFSAFDFCFSWRVFCCSFLINSKEAERKSIKTQSSTNSSKLHTYI